MRSMGPWTGLESARGYRGPSCPAPPYQGEPGPLRPLQLLDGGDQVPTGGLWLLPEPQAGQGPARIRANDRYGGPTHIHDGLSRQHRRPRRIRLSRCHRARALRTQGADHGRGSGNDHQSRDRGPERPGRHGLDHQPPRSCHPHPGPSRLPAAWPLRRDQPGNHQPPRLSRGAFDGLPQSGTCQGAFSQAERADRGDQRSAGLGRFGPIRQVGSGCHGYYPPGGEGDQVLQGGQALRHRDRRWQLWLLRGPGLGDPPCPTSSRLALRWRTPP